MLFRGATALEFKEIIAIYTDNHKIPINTKFGVTDG
jgi:hypothetical protein